jgi:hypothetical protein
MSGPLTSLQVTCFSGKPTLLTYGKKFLIFEKLDVLYQGPKASLLRIRSPKMFRKKDGSGFGSLSAHISLENSTEYTECQSLWPVVWIGSPRSLTRKRECPHHDPRGRDTHSFVGKGVVGANLDEGTETMVVFVLIPSIWKIGIGDEQLVERIHIYSIKQERTRQRDRSAYDVICDKYL